MRRPDRGAAMEDKVNAGNEESALQCWLVRVSGRVQGVGYRESCVDCASQIGVAGWVRNRADGTVEVLLQGSSAQLARMRQWLQRGPPAAVVHRVEVTELASGLPRLDGFERRPTE